MIADDVKSDKDLKVVEFLKSGRGQAAAVERAPGLWEVRGLGNSHLITTSEGDVLVNAGGLGDARHSKTLFDKVSPNPTRYIILTQSHVNQYGGLEVYKTPDNTVIAHRLYAEERVYGKALSGHYRHLGLRIFGDTSAAMGALYPTQEVAPDLLIGDEGHTLELGGRKIEIIWTPGGETRSSVIVWLPAQRIAIVGNLFGPLFGNYPNLNTMRGDKVRWATQFIESVKKLRALKPEMILTGFEEISGAEHIERETTRIIDAVQWLHDQTIEGMNAGKDLRTLMREIAPPPEFALTEEYGKLAWNVRAIWHEYTGWFDSSRGTTDLYGVPPSNVAPAIAELAGGAARLAERARAFVAEDKPLEALHLLDIALVAEPDSLVSREVKRDALNLLSTHTNGKNVWERKWIETEIRDLALPDAG